MTDHSPRDEWLSVAQAAPVIGASPSKIRGLIWAGALKASQHTPGGKFQLRRSECDRYVAELEARTLNADSATDLEAVR